MKELKLNNSELKALVDDEDYERLSKFTWTLNTSGKSKNARVCRSIRKFRRTKTFPLSNEVMKNFDLMYDHKDVNGLNNQKENLRPATYSQNNHNSFKYTARKYTSKYKGVSLRKENNTWRACIAKDNEYINLGHFKTEIEAALAYNKKALELYGDFANLNKISSGEETGCDQPQ